ncbi:MAG: aminotransferase class V-fold PLP-dependent enzyme, partial [Planctomycetes bacterium]|nr:aminotransferase class V-fold PLP-dependent enzyme [Planctomycetota bacterium]
MSAPDWQSFRSVFPAVNESTYLMTARRGPLSVPARRAIERILDEHTHRPGELVFVWRDHERVVGDKVARYLGASPKSIALTPSATAGLALAANGIVWKEGDEVVLPSIEFPANVYPWMQLERHGVKLRRIPPNALGVVTAAMLLEAITPRTRVVTASHVSFLNGYRIDVAALAAGCRKRGVLSVIDAAQTGGWMAIEFDALGCDVLVGLAQKYFCFPDGLGFFLIRPDAMNVIKPSAPGKMSVKHYNEFLDHRLDYSEDAWRFVSGSMATPQLYAFEAMVEFFASYGKEAIDRRCMEL